ncbi:DUF6701 domain-containing protein [Sulfurivermis fontis]|uniref:DUF6701 domain-containing protein n=1 Tax=Sulfurivermis fontis TaxID=1972068 RepID=UPI000FDC4E1E|nr:DUF6701 domain-containing protein [Sulfurivermis fontis]
MTPLSFWIKTTQVGNDTNWQAPGVAGVEQSGGTNDIFWGWLDAAGHIGISKGNDNTAKSTVAINDGTWHHVVLSRNAGDGAYKIYLDGALNKSGTTNSGIVSTSFSSIGRIEDTAGSHEYFVGELDEVFIFDGVLTDADVASIYALQSAGKNLDGSERDCPTPSTCYVDDFNRAALGTDWSVSNSSGSFGDPRIVNNRLRLTDASGNVATAATLQKLFPGAGNLIVLEFDYFAYNGNGADGIAVTFSDSSITPSPGGYGGSLGYAQRCGVNGFAGGWLGVGIDEYGNFNNDDECRGDGPPPSGRVIDSLSVRGSGSGTVGYRRLSGTGTLRPGIDQSGATPAPGHRYRVTIDHLTTPGQAIYTVERQTTPGGPWVTHLTGDALASVGQAPVPENWILSFTGSTGGSTNIHEIDNISVCATKMLPVSTTVNHFRFYHDGSGLTCAPENIQVRACLDSACSVEASGDITATLAPSGWIDGSPVTFASSDTLQLQHTTAETVALGVISSTPSALNPPRCYIGGVEQANCNITFHDSGFVFDIPNHDASTTQNITIKAIRKDNETQQCVPGFTDVTKTVNFWSTYVDPGTGTLAVNVNDTDVAGASPGTELDLDFDSTGVASLQVVYPDAGQMQLDARYEGSGDDAGLVMTGQDMFVARPDHFTLTGIVCADGTANPGAADAGGAAFCAAGEDFRVTVAARNAVGDITPNFGRESAPESVALATTLVAPVGGSNPVLAGSFGSFGEDCAGDPATAGTACGTFTWPEVGIVTLTPSIASGNYLGAGNVTGSVSGNVGRFHPASFGVTHTPDVGCGTTFTYAGLSGSKVGQPFSVTGTITARNVAGATTANYAGAFAKLGTGDVTAMPMQGAAAAAGVLTWNVDSLTFAAGVGAMTATARYAFTAEGGPQAMHLRVMADDGEASGEENDSGKAVEYRLGRLRLQNAYGAELADIAVPMQAEYYDAGGYYRRNDADNCTALTLADHLELRNPQTDSGDWQSGDTTMTVGGGSTAALPINSPLVSGDAGLVFTAPGAGHTGYVDIRTSLTTDHPWLGHAWNCDAAAPSEACGRVSFGLYQGSRHHIYLRERY